MSASFRVKAAIFKVAPHRSTSGEGKVVTEAGLIVHTSIGAHNEHFLHHRRRGHNGRSCGLLGSAPLNKQFDTSEVGLKRRVSNGRSPRHSVTNDESSVGWVRRGN